MAQCILMHCPGLF